MRRVGGRRIRLLIAVGVIATGIAAIAQASSAAPAAKSVKIAVMTDCKGAFAFAFEGDIAGANAAFSDYAGARPKDKNKPSAGVVGAKAGGAKLTFTDYGCGDDTVATMQKEIRRLMVQQNADVMLGPLSGDEAVATANWAKSHPTKTIIIGTAGSQDPTMQIAPKNVFRYFGDGAQWNAGIGEILYKKLHWRNAAIIMDDYSFGWTSAAGIIADFCAIGGKITKRVYPPLNTTDYSAYVRQLPAPDKVDGYFWVVGGTGTDPAFKAFEQAYGPIKATQHSGNLFLWSSRVSLLHRGSTARTSAASGSGRDWRRPRRRHTETRLRSGIRRSVPRTPSSPTTTVGLTHSSRVSRTRTGARARHCRRHCRDRRKTRIRSRTVAR